MKRSAPSTALRSRNGFRTLIHWALRFVRPLFAPLLNRLQFRMLSAVEQSSIVPGLQVVEAESLMIKARILEIKIKLSEIETRFEQFQNQLVGLESLLKELGVSLLNSDQQRSKQVEIQTAEIMAGLDMSQINKHIQSQTAELSARLDVLQVSCDVLRLNQMASGRLDRLGVA